MRVLSLCLALLLSAVVAFRGEAFESNLSDAMKQSAGETDQPVDANDTHSHSHSSHDSDYTDSDEDDGSFSGFLAKVTVAMLASFHGVYYDDANYFWQIPLDAAYVVPLNGEIQGMTRFSFMPFTVEGEHAAFGLYINGGLVNFKNGSLPDNAAHNANTLGVGAAFRYFFSKAEKKWSPYLTTSVGWQQIAWDYRSPVVTTGGDRIASDALGGLDAYAGFGVAFMRSRRFSLFGEAGFGGIIFDGKTDEGFHNNVFDDFGYFSVKAGLSFKF